MSKSLKISFSIIGTFFVFLFFAEGYLINLALKTKQPVVDERYYEKGLFFQEELKKKKIGEEEKWKAVSSILESDEISTGSQKIQIKIYSEKNIKLETAQVYIVLERPASSTLRQKKMLNMISEEKNPGEGSLFETKLNVVGTGEWDFSIKALINNKAAIDITRRITAL
ncbi:MAG: FixH family protein [Spirochaetia bacterium]|nr:FixH family protein [Spirochaetia bacterium]